MSQQPAPYNRHARLEAALLRGIPTGDLDAALDADARRGRDVNPDDESEFGTPRASRRIDNGSDNTA